MSLLERIVLLLLVASLFLPDAVRSMRCHACESEATNEDCNADVTECEADVNDACYTVIVKTDTFGRRYTKGCTNMLKCRKLQALNDRKACPYVSSDCIYCCDNKANCNAYNTAPAQPTTARTLCLLLLGAYLAW